MTDSARPSVNVLAKEADELIDREFMERGGRIRLAPGTSRRGRLVATARAIEASFARRDLLRTATDRFGLIMQRLMRRLHKGLLAFADNVAEHVGIVRAHFSDRSIGSDARHGRRRGRQSFSNRPPRPAMVR